MTTEKLGCDDDNCLFHRTKDMGIDGRCSCIQRQMTAAHERKLRRTIAKMSQRLRLLEEISRDSLP